MKCLILVILISSVIPCSYCMKRAGTSLGSLAVCFESDSSGNSSHNKEEEDTWQEVAIDKQLQKVQGTSIKRVESSNDTAIFVSDSGSNTPRGTLRKVDDQKIRELQKKLAETPKTVTAFLYALMRGYHVDVAREMVKFNDHRNSGNEYAMHIDIIGDWVEQICSIVTCKKRNGQPIMDTHEADMVQVHLQYAQALFWEFKQCLDLCEEDPDFFSYIRLLRHTRKIRIDAFKEKKIDAIVGAKYLSMTFEDIRKKKEADTIDKQRNSKKKNTYSCWGGCAIL